MNRSLKELKIDWYMTPSLTCLHPSRQRKSTFSGPWEGRSNMALFFNSHPIFRRYLRSKGYVRSQIWTCRTHDFSSDAAPQWRQPQTCSVTDLRLFIKWNRPKNLSSWKEYGLLTGNHPIFLALRDKFIMMQSRLLRPWNCPYGLPILNKTDSELQQVF